jgi:predicted nucleic acid-binding protein
MKKSFLDTNVILYANDDRAGAKRKVAIELLERVIADRSGVVSTQVCMEYASVAVGKFGQSPDVVQCQLAALESLEVVQVNIRTIQAGLALMRIHNVSYWDAVIIAAAQAAHCQELLTEGFNTGQLYGSVRAVNPFE